MPFDTQPTRGTPQQLLLKFLIGLTLILPQLTYAEDSGENHEEPRHSQNTFNSLLKKTIRAFSAEDYASSIKLYAELETTFGREPEYTADRVQMTLLPAWGYACYMSKQYEQAAVLFKKYLTKYPKVKARRDFVIYTLALAYEKSGATRKAIETFNQFRNEFPGKPEANLVWMHEARLLFESNENALAFELLDKYYHSNAKRSLRFQGRLLALQKAEELGDIERAEHLLLQTPWSINQMPQLAVLTFSAIKIGDRLMEEKRYPQALQAYRLVPPKQSLVLLQSRRLQELQYEAKTTLKRYKRSPNAVFWAQHYSDLIAKVKGQLQGLRDSDDYTSAFLLRYGQAFLLLNRGQEAWLVFEELAVDEKLDPAIREQAHFRWIVAARSLKAWDDALAVARGFVKRYPDSPEAPLALYMLAESFQELRSYAKAIDVLSDIIERYKDNPLVDRWLFIRGYNYTLINNNLDARNDFAEYIRRNPKGIIVAQARLWHALTFYSERQYAEALASFDDMLGRGKNKKTEKTLIPKNHPLFPEIKYRRASTIYAMRQYESALASIDEYLQDHPHHTHSIEAAVLRGDILMGTGELDKAIEAFAAIGPDAKGLFPYAVFQIGKIYKSRIEAIMREDRPNALRDLAKMIYHFEHYIERNDVPNKAQVSDALYWIAWAYTLQGEPKKAFPILFQTLSHFGNNRNSTEIPNILHGFHRIHNNYKNGLPGKSGFVQARH